MLDADSDPQHRRRGQRVGRRHHNSDADADNLLHTVPGIDGRGGGPRLRGNAG